MEKCFFSYVKEFSYYFENKGWVLEGFRKEEICMILYKFYDIVESKFLLNMIFLFNILQFREEIEVIICKREYRNVIIKLCYVDYQSIRIY